MVVTKTADCTAGSLETEQRNMSEHDFLNGRVPHVRHGAPPRKNPLNYLIIESTGWLRPRAEPFGLFRDGEFDPGSE